MMCVAKVYHSLLDEKQKEVGGLTNPLLKKALVLLVAWLGGDLTLWVQCLLIVDQGIRHR